MKWVYEKKKAGNFGNKIFISPTFFAFRKDCMLHVTASGFILKMLHVFDAIREIVYFTSTD